MSPVVLGSTVDKSVLVVDPRPPSLAGGKRSSLSSQGRLWSGYAMAVELAGGQVAEQVVKPADGCRCLAADTGMGRGHCDVPPAAAGARIAADGSPAEPLPSARRPAA